MHFAGTMYYSEPRPDRSTEDGRRCAGEDGAVFRREIDCASRGTDEGPRRLASRRGTPQRDWRLEERRERA